ncbi:hypothetical protein Plec18167_000308 [Paecilomyces lecythidis]|uniref:NTP binding protein n=1 Tax=Paecilomyces lecythidis TaxID=3004212 RepID=A0ABR3YEY8_9EURO
MSAAPLDPVVSSIIDRNNPVTNSDDFDEDAIFEDLENEDDSAYRSRRIEQLSAELKSAQDAVRSIQRDAASNITTVHDALYPTLPNDQVLLDFTTQNQRCVVHFAHPDFAKCGVMDEHLRLLASRHYEVRFARVDVRDCPFVVEKLNVRVLPCVIGFVDGVGAERVLGFEGLGAGSRDGVKGFKTVELEKRLVTKGVLSRRKLAEDGGPGIPGDADSDSESADDSQRGGQRRAIRSGNARNRRATEDDDDDDWD